MKNKFVALSKNTAIISALAFIVAISSASLVYADDGFSSSSSSNGNQDGSGLASSSPSTNPNQDGSGSSGSSPSTNQNQDGSGLFSSSPSTNPNQDNPAPDTTPPIISAVSDITVTTSDSNTDSVAVDYTTPTATDAVDGTTVVSCDPASGSAFIVGTTTVTCTSTDKSGNTATTTFNVIVNYGPVPAVEPVISPSTGGGGGGGGGGFYGGNSAVPLAITATSPASATTSCPLITSYLQFGANNDGSQIAQLQAFLKDEQGLNVNVTGIFDAQTLAAVKAFQTKYLSDTMGPWGEANASGYVYITTSKKINELACNSPLTLSPAELAIIDAFKNSHSAGAAAPAVGTNNGAAGTANTATGPVAPTLNASTTPLAPQVGENTTGNNANTAAAGNAANTASVVNAPVIVRLWNWFKGLF